MLVVVARIISVSFVLALQDIPDTNMITINAMINSAMVITLVPNKNRQGVPAGFDIYIFKP